MPKQDSFLQTVLKLSIPVTFFIICLETIENYSLFYSFFPRNGFFKIIFNWTIIKFLLFPIIKLAFFTTLIYFIPILFGALLITFCGRIVLKIHKRRKPFLTALFYGFSLYSFLYLLVGFNALLNPVSQGKHPVLYMYIFPHWNANALFSEFFNIFHFISFGYWMIITGVSLACLIKYKWKTALLFAFIGILGIFILAFSKSSFVSAIASAFLIKFLAKWVIDLAQSILYNLKYLYLETP